MNEVFPHKFVELIPKALEERILYVSIEHAIAVHLCACGCARKVVTPLAPIHWKLIFDGRSVSLAPSIGNHAFPCKSHYWIKRGRVRWSYEMSTEEVEAVRARDKRMRREFYNEDGEKLATPAQEKVTPVTPVSNQKQITQPRHWWRRLLGS